MKPTPADFLAEALCLYVCRTKPDSHYADPLFRRRLPHWHAQLGRDVIVTLMPDLVLRVRDPQTGLILAQSQPGRIDQLDDAAPAHLEIVRAPWMNVRPRTRGANPSQAVPLLNKSNPEEPTL